MGRLHNLLTKSFSSAQDNLASMNAAMRHAKRNPSPMTDWVNGLLEKKPFRLASFALANKLARIAWAIPTRGETYRPYYGHPA